MMLFVPPVVLLDHQDPPTLSQAYIQKESLSLEEENRLYEEYEARINAEWKALHQEETQEKMYTDHRAFYGVPMEEDKSAEETRHQKELREDYYNSIRLF